uniref:uncharacterized protein LOC117603332 n=1 Tax=Osmia lignaria TaxID=473952 RepID=UPI0014786009|nr:uncharacterized protein LOC117603332 [Osmia lignaria]
MQHLRLSSPDSGRMDGGAAAKKKSGDRRGNSDEKEDRAIHTFVQPLFMVVGVLKREGRIGGQTPEVPFSRRIRITDDVHNIHPQTFLPYEDTCVLDLFLAIQRTPVYLNNLHP